MFYLLLAFFGCMTGVTAVLFGFGGGFVVVPLLYSMLMASHGADSPIGQAAMHIAVATSTCVMIVNALVATAKHWRAGNLIGHYLWPLAGFIGLGAIVGAVAAMWVSGAVIRYAFIAYLVVTIVDCLFRRGFLSHAENRMPRRLERAEVSAGGVGIKRHCDLSRRRRQRHDCATAAAMRAKHEPGDLHGEPAELARGPCRDSHLYGDG